MTSEVRAKHRMQLMRLLAAAGCRVTRACMLTFMQRCLVSTRQQQHSCFWKPVASIQVLGRGKG